MTKITISQTFDVAAAPPPPPPPPPGLSATFVFTPSNPQTGQLVTFTANVTGGASPYSYAWLFGDDSQGTGSVATHVYNTAGQYQAVLKIGRASCRERV